MTFGSPNMIRSNPAVNVIAFYQIHKGMGAMKRYGISVEIDGIKIKPGNIVITQLSQLVKMCNVLYL